MVFISLWNFDSDGYFPLQKNTLHDVLPVLYKEHSIFFEIKPTGIVSNWGNIIRFEIEGDEGSDGLTEGYMDPIYGRIYGQQIPALFFHPGSTTIALSHASEGGTDSIGNIAVISMNVWSTILIGQVKVDILNKSI